MNSTRSCSLLAAFALGALASCRQTSWQSRPMSMPRDDVVTTSGVRTRDIFAGMGPSALVGDVVLLDYTLWLEDEKRVDSTLDRGVPIEVVIGSAFVKGLDDGLLGIRPEGRRRITVPPELGYGDKGVEGLIPGGSTLVFEVHALEVHRAKP